ncbi:hypothetical protein [Desulfobacter postgatei]|jgi:hypothetical protein|uniref:hypothetical protein n=1 Tax=Desulfobacter postgatei TaxID=2293 RepID=UPI002A359220|nr:hypothetical protein [Desulfobacter postgatei]MDX9964218.1 hypothetical protein [Desulfobacter postgatei]
MELEKQDQVFRWGDITENDFGSCAELGGKTFSIDRNIMFEWFRKRLAHNPWQNESNSMGIGLWRDNTLMGYRAMSRQPWWMEGRQGGISFAAQTVMSTELRGMGLGNELIRRSSMCGDFTGSTSAGVVSQKIYSKLGFHAIGADNHFYRSRVSFAGTMSKRFGVVGKMLAPAMEKISGLSGKYVSDGLRFQQLERCDERFDELWLRARKGYRSCLVRSSAYLNWRIFDHPTCPLYISGIFEDDGRGPLRAFAVWHVQAFDKHVKMAALRDLFSEVDDDTARKLLLATLFETWRKMRISWASLEVAHPSVTKLFDNMGFEQVPSKGGRYHISANKALDDGVKAEWFRSGLDGDYFDLSGSQYV